jgi:hypothetical protein
VHIKIFVFYPIILAEILRYFDENADEKNWKWLAIVDDDTLISFSKLADLLQCYQNYEQPGNNTITYHLINQTLPKDD